MFILRVGKWDENLMRREGDEPHATEPKPHKRNITKEIKGFHSSQSLGSFAALEIKGKVGIVVRWRWSLIKRL